MNNTVELIGHYGNDELHALSAWTSTSRELDEAKRSRIPALLSQLASNGHHTPFEKSMIHFLVRCDTASHIHLLKHRIGVSCLSGEQEISFLDANGDTTPKLRFTMDQLFKKWNNGRSHQNTEKDAAYSRKRIMDMRLRTVDFSTGLVSSTNISDVLYMGQKEVFEWSSDGVKSLKCTSDHLLRARDGWITAEEADASGHEVGVLQYCGDAPLGKNINDWPEKWAPVFGLEGRYEVSDMGCVRSVWSPRYGTNKASMKKPTTNPHGYKVVSLSEHGTKFVHHLVLEAFIGVRQNGNQCRHLDNNPANNHISNLVWGTAKENSSDRTEIGKSQMRMVFQKIKRVKSLGLQPTYDLTVTHPEHAFCASSFVVHNCNGESARYKEIKDVSSLVPSDWPLDIQNALKSHCMASNELYHATLARLTPLLGRARAKESARFFLPYANQLTLDVSFNFRSFQHFLGLRNKPEAQKEIRDIASNMLDLVANIDGSPFKHTLAAFKL